MRGDVAGPPDPNTVDTWIAWQLSDGALHVTDLTNQSVTGLMRSDAELVREFSAELLLSRRRVQLDELRGGAAAEDAQK